MHTSGHDSRSASRFGAPSFLLNDLNLAHSPLCVDRKSADQDKTARIAKDFDAQLFRERSPGRDLRGEFVPL
jgi:hypothetical protein